MASIFDKVNEFFGVASGDERKRRIDRAVDDASKGKKAKDATLGNPEGKKKKKKKK